jgi:hypothetical protein
MWRKTTKKKHSASQIKFIKSTNIIQEFSPLEATEFQIAGCFKNQNILATHFFKIVHPHISIQIKQQRMFFFGMTYKKK